MDGLYTFLEGLLNKDNKKKLLTDAMFRGAISKIKPDQECLKEGMMEVYDDAVHLRVAPCWSNDEYGKVFKSLRIKKIVVSPAANYSKGIILWPNMSDMEIYLNNEAWVSSFSYGGSITWTNVKVVSDGKWNVLFMDAADDITLKNCQILTTSQPPSLLFSKNVGFTCKGEIAFINSHSDIAVTIESDKVTDPGPTREAMKAIKQLDKGGLITDPAFVKIVDKILKPLDDFAPAYKWTTKSRGDKTNSLYLWDPDKTKTNKVYSYGAHWLKYNQELNIMAIKAGECLT